MAFGVAAGALLVGVRGTQDAVANGDTRTISIRHMHTKEELTVTFKRDGRYVAEALEKLNWALRDWRTDEPIRMDPRLFDVAWEVQRMTGSQEPFHVVSAYRSPGTNSMLRRRSRAVAKHSQHMLGKAMDFYLPDTSTVRIREAGMLLQRGGVGFYPGAHTPFVHLDAGSVRSWPRMTRDQLVRLFPDEKTVHLPADGQPLAGYELAKADILAGGGAVAGYAAADLDEGAVISSGRKSLWASLFGGDEEEAEARPTRGRRVAPKPQPAVMVYGGGGYADSNSSDGGRFAVAALPEATTGAVGRERSQRLTARPDAAPPAQAVAPAPAPAPAPQPAQPPLLAEARPQFMDVPLPLARPRSLALPAGADGGFQLASVPDASRTMSYAPQPMLGLDQKLVLASLPPRRPDQIAGLVETPAEAALANAPFPPARPTALGGLTAAVLRGSGDAGAPAPAANPAVEGRLVAVNHPLPPVRPTSGGTSVAARSEPQPAPSHDVDRSGLDSLFATVARSRPPSGAAITVATARVRPAVAAPAPIHGPSPAAALGFSKAEPSDTRSGAFSGPAVRPLPPNFVQN
ncbi:MAG: peptidase domain containing protein [Chelatococcus sp.]|nr:MAG: peptidase domain containing protein [Chelatococcus sp.]